MVCYTPEGAESLVRAFRSRVWQLTFCSTVDVYNKPTAFYPCCEDHPREAASDYGRSKAKCEDVLMAAHERGDFKVTIIRPAHTYGEGGTLMHTFGWRTHYLDRIRKGKPVIQHGNGNSLWVVCHIDDVARAFVNAICNERAYGKTYHTTSEEWLTWNRYLEIIAEAMGAPKPKIVHIPTDLLAKLVPHRVHWTVVNFQYSNVFDNTAAKRDLGFRYTIPFLEGAHRTIRWLEGLGLIEDCSNGPVYDWLIEFWEEATSRMIDELKRLTSRQ
ncbi:MAG: NAD-dependent epimerase/dehydratase family protein [Armatimonadetes bacterium]|nr:NAD-dependent epimerase/dehydratase family protein [Armatimonadota bacterium]